ncbi:MAG: hypothetical protein GX947_02475 [Tissierellia bacterium]|nr:hypothetical protein [Tissierellia bacterium]
MKKEIVEAILGHPIVYNTINKQCRKYSFLYDDLRGDLVLLAIESINKFEKDKPIWDRVHPQLFQKDSKDPELIEFKYKLLRYLHKTLSFRAWDIANKKQYISTDNIEELPSPPPLNYRSYYKQYFWNNFGKLTKRQQQFCIDFINGKEVCRVKKHYIVKRIGKKLEVKSMNVRESLLKAEKEYISKLLASFSEDNFIDIIEKTMDRMAGEWVLYDYMNIKLRQQLILYMADVVISRVKKTPIREIPLEAIEEYYRGLIEWLKR